MFEKIATLLRLMRIARTLARHDALAAFEEERLIPGKLAAVAVWWGRKLSRRNTPGRPGEKLARALTELGPSFIKLGQFLSTRADLLGEQLATDLAQLQDQLSPFDGSLAKSIIEKELGRDLEQLFLSFDMDAISAASIAQVHFAETIEGEAVAVKVLRPGVEESFRKDLKLFYSLASLLEKSRPSFRRFRLTEVVQTFHDTVRLEMDLRMEAAGACELAENFADDFSYDTPSIDWDRTSRRVLTMSRVEGIPLDDREALLAAGHNLEEVLTSAAAIFFNQVFRDGFFHGDQHPGNMFVGDDGRLVAVDFGIMGRLDKNTRFFLADMLVALLREDYVKLAEAHVTAGLIPANQSIETFAQALRSVCQPIMGKDLSHFSFAKMLGQMLHLAESFDMTIQPHLLLLQKNMVMAEGVSRSLDENLNLWSLAQPLVEDWILKNRGPEARVREGITTLSGSLEKLPRLISNLEAASEKFSQSGLRLHSETIQDFHKESSGTARWAFILAIASLAFSIGFTVNFILFYG
ncbi:2-polyprenylphenol 6-hydroxylase [Kiloniella laminariae]|uniref:2-polyprenylphenol 6-hydroxylase n=1 Tax=Kiloniella laminariae TaxID=454162 RepID=A0ABT4LIQ7_9PROT|nr:2-polyprenylphenol 6-hydroxylase [Kiloniella laminariae]MCZ4280984.1 2-polyprenylphenol 6-hydroxylase [Kiloniella laminariae]